MRKILYLIILDGNTAIWTNFKPLENGSVTFESFLYLIGFLVFLLFVLIIAMGKVKPNEVSDYEGEITNNNNTSVNMYGTDEFDCHAIPASLVHFTYT